MTVVEELLEALDGNDGLEILNLLHKVTHHENPEIVILAKEALSYWRGYMRTCGHCHPRTNLYRMRQAIMRIETIGEIGDENYRTQL